MMGNRRLIWTAAISLLILGHPVEAQQAAPPPDSVQGRFNTAADLLKDGNAKDALPLFEALEKQLQSPPKSSATSLAIARYYKGNALMRMNRLEEAREATLLALSDGALSKPATKDTLRLAREQLARLHERLMNDTDAAETYAVLRASAEDDAQRARYLLRQASALSVLEPARALTLSNEAVTLLEALPKEAKEDRASIHAIRGRALLNLGQVKDARAAFQSALRAYGSLDTSVDTMEYALRADAAYAALRDGELEDARKFMAYAGQGTSQRRAFPVPGTMPLPQCGGLDELKPDDVAIIEAAITSGGEVAIARPVFATRAGRMGYLFSESVRDWRWQPEVLTGINPVLLRRLRFEVRCTQAFPAANVSNARDALSAWLNARPNGVRPPIPADKAEADRLARAEADPARAASAWLHYSYRQDLKAGEREFAVTEAGKAAGRAGAPLEISALARAEGLSDSNRGFGRAAASRRSAINMRPMLDEPEIRADPEASARLRLFLATLYGEARMGAEERAALDEVVSDKRLPEKHPLRTAALLGLANAAAAQDDTANAAEAFAATGLSPSQCAALSQKPILLKKNTSSDDYPLEAIAWGFTGWVRAEYDIDANGKTANIRHIASFPAGIFNKAGSRVVGDFAYRKSYRPDGSAGCTASGQSIVFGIIY